MKNLIVLIALLIITFSMTKAEEISFNKDVDINVINEKTGLSYSHSSYEDDWIFSAQYAFNTHLLKVSDLTSLEVSLAKKMSNQYFLLFSYNQTTALLDEFTSTRESAFSDQSIEADTTTYSLTEIGGGVLFRSTLIQDFIKSNSIYDTISSQINYVSTTIEEASFSGYGLKSSYGIHKRFGRSLELGIKFNYHLARLERSNPPEEGQKLNFVASWASLGVTASYVF